MKNSDQLQSQPRTNMKDTYAEPVFYDVNISHNNSLITRLKDITSLSFGCCSGILQLTAWKGVFLFLIANLVSGVLFYFLIISGPKASKQYFKKPLFSIFIGDFARYFSSYVMAWCLLYALVN